MKPSKYHTPLFERILSRMRRQPRGQSFVELMLVVLVLALILAGMVEFGFLMNNYLHVLDASREAARYSSSSTPFVPQPNGDIGSYYYPPFYYVAAGKAAQTMDPVLLNPANPDDIVVSVFTMNGVNPIRYPAADPNGWSLCEHYKANAKDAGAVDTSGNHPFGGGFVAYFPSLTPPAPVPSELPSSLWSAGCTVRTTQFSNAQITSLISSVAPPSTGIVLVEIFYSYPQLLKLPVLTNVLPDPIPLYVYTLMPLSAAQPTQIH